MDTYAGSILKVLAYFDIYHYPVKQEEIEFFLNQPASPQKLRAALDELVSIQAIWHIDGFYSLHNDAALVERRLKGNLLAVKQLKRAAKVARIIMAFPYVKGVGISGSLSKNFAYEGSDLDFFIITQANRLWIAKTILHSIVKFFKLERWACLNYFIDETTLEIPEHNIFTATELATLIPMQNKEQVFQRFFVANYWVSGFLPNRVPKIAPENEPVTNFLRRLIEWLLNSKQGERLESWLLRYFQKRWQKLRLKNKFTPKGFMLGGVIADKHTYKPFPHHYQKKILSIFDEKVKSLQRFSQQTETFES